jgi:pimeloyl-ACP methyl ester carboxylesterase/cell wall-associated NlpC family hydrolase
MPTIMVNGAELYYRELGPAPAGRAPIVLIHGTTSTGQRDWHLVAPLLAREYRTIVLDCRGHGRSTNPDRSYSFRQMAADVAGLVRALGHERAHLIGHSNGGNVALVTLLEHADVVQTAVLQAANAYVSADLVEEEPAKFDPDRVARESPGWMEMMIALHGPTHGPDYWRELLRMTLQETISEPSYRPEELGEVHRPTLVIQGEKDWVNARGRHAQYIARHIPQAELWLPAGIGHAVHDEALLSWTERVLDFLARRGDDPNDALYRLRQRRYADNGLWLFEVKARQGEGGEVALSGRVLTAEQREAAVEAVAPRTAATEGLRVLLRAESPWALVNRCLADLWGEPRIGSERVSQALVGEALRILEEEGDWARVRLERDGYLGWVQTATLHRCDEDQVQRYGDACNALVQGELPRAYLDPSAEGPPVGKLPFGVAVPVVEERGDWAAVRLPDGRLWWVGSADLLPVAGRPEPGPDGIAATLDLIRRFVGVPYLWGGCTPFGYDCSALAQVFWGFMGVTIPRDAHQQFFSGVPVPDGEGTGEAIDAGDLLFFGAPADEEGHGCRRITHVGISLGGYAFIHAYGGTTRSVAYNSLDPAATDYRESLRRIYQGTRRFGRGG